MTTLALVWLGILTLLLLYEFFVIMRLFRVKDRGLRQSILDNLDGNKKLSNEIMALERVCQKQEEALKLGLQKTALVRFNPFERLGGEQSYCLAILNNKNSGVVITFLYTKEGVRAYVKEVEGGKGGNIDLSKEEKEAIEKASSLKL